VDLIGLIKVCVYEISDKLSVGIYLSRTYFVEDGMEDASVLSPLFFNFPQKYVMRNVEENNEVMELNGIHQVTVLAVVNTLGKNVNSKKKI
jgi:hypothetical protein